MTGALRIQAWKELRELLPWWGAMVVTIIALGEIGDLDMLRPLSSSNLVGAGVLVYILGSVALGALSIGHEYSHRALPMLLARPIGRARMLATKLGVLAVLLAALAAIAMWQLWTDAYVWRRPWAVRTFLLLPPIGALFLTPWLTMISRGPLAGAVFSIPLIVYVISVQTHLNGTEAMNFAVASTLGLVGFGGALTWRAFLRLEAIDGPHAEVGVPVWLRRRVASEAWSSLNSPVVRNRFWLLLRKELRLQQMTLVVSGLCAALWIAVLTAHKAFPDAAVPALDVFSILHGVLIALLAGAMASAEERQLGTSDWQALLPMAGGKQWTVKVGTAVGLALLLGVGLPAILAVMTANVDPGILGSLSNLELDEEWSMALLALCAGALYVSSLSSSGMRAFLASFPTIAIAMLGGALALGPVGLGASYIFRDIAPAITPFSGLDRRDVAQVTHFLVLVPILAALVLLLLRFAYRNHRSADRSATTIRHQIGVMLIGAIGGVILAAFAKALLEAGLTPFPR